MEPTTAISALAKLIGVGMKGWSAIEARGFEEKDVAALQSLLETGASFASMRTPEAPLVAAQHLALVARSFGQAVGGTRSSMAGCCSAVDCVAGSAGAIGSGRRRSRCG